MIYNPVIYWGHLLCFFSFQLVFVILILFFFQFNIQEKKQILPTMSFRVSLKRKHFLLNLNAILFCLRFFKYLNTWKILAKSDFFFFQLKCQKFICSHLEISNTSFSIILFLLVFQLVIYRTPFANKKQCNVLFSFFFNTVNDNSTNLI